MKINKEDHNFYQFKIDEVYKKFEGDLTYVNTFCVKEAYLPVAVFHNESPNRKKNHKDFLLLWIDDAHNLMIAGMDFDEISKYRYQVGMYCPECKEVIYSVNRHDYRTCKCGKCMVDGGKDYFKTNMAGQVVNVDLLTDEITPVGSAPVV